jgi:hypothetical protein
VDHMCHSFDFMAAWTGKWLHDGWIHSRSTGHRHHRGAGPGHTGAKTLVAVWAFAGEAEASEKGMVRGSQMISDNP